MEKGGRQTTSLYTKLINKHKQSPSWSRKTSETVGEIKTERDGTFGNEMELTGCGTEHHEIKNNLI